MNNGYDDVMRIVTDVVATELRVPREKVSPTADLFADVGADSLDALNIAIRLEKEFNIKIPDSALSEFRTVTAIAERIALLDADGLRPGAAT